MMICQLLHDVLWSFHQGKLHWLFPDGTALATWVLAFFALIPLLALKNSINSKKRDDQFRLIQWLDSQFNSAAMLAARRETGKTMPTRDFIQGLRQDISTSAWPIVMFFDRVAVLWAQGRLELGDIDIAYREYIFRIWADYGKHLSNGLLQGKHNQLENLRSALQRMDDPRRTDDLAAAVARVQEEFWRRESQL